MMNKSVLVVQLVLGLLTVLLACAVAAADFDIARPKPEDVTLKITGRLLEPAPCTITGTGEKGAISVDFNEVKINKIDGNNYRRQINYQLSCIANRENSLMLHIVGAPAAFGSGFLKTDVDDLAISITHDNSPYPINTFLNFSWPIYPVLYATPVMRSGASLKGKPFSASAVMQVYYQ